MTKIVQIKGEEKVKHERVLYVCHHYHLFNICSFYNSAYLSYFCMHTRT
jgi:hypothetical protein